MQNVPVVGVHEGIARQAGRTMEAFSRENREAIYKAANLRITYRPTEREVDLALSFFPGGGACRRGPLDSYSTGPASSLLGPELWHPAN